MVAIAVDTLGVIGESAAGKRALDKQGMYLRFYGQKYLTIFAKFSFGFKIKLAIPAISVQQNININTISPTVFPTWKILRFRKYSISGNISHNTLRNCLVV